MKDLMHILLLILVPMCLTAQEKIELNWMKNKYKFIGEKSFKEIGFTGKNIEPILAKNELALAAFQKYKKNRKNGLIAMSIPMTAGVTIFIIDVVESEKRKNSCSFLCGPIEGVAALFGAGIVGFVINLPFKYVANDHLKKSVAHYNGEKTGVLPSEYQKPTFQIGTSKYDLGLSFAVIF